MSFERIRRARHNDTRETALVMLRTDGTLVAQFDRFEHPQSHGWHEYPARDFTLLEIEGDDR